MAAVALDLVKTEDDNSPLANILAGIPRVSAQHLLCAYSLRLASGGRLSSTGQADGASLEQDEGDQHEASTLVAGEALRSPAGCTAAATRR